MVFVAGGTGFIGSHFLRILKDSGRDAKCLVHSPAKGSVCTSMGFTTSTGDITERDSIRGAFGGVDTVVHLVGIIEERGKQTFLKVHFQGTVNLVEEASLAGVKRFVYVSAIGADLDSRFAYHRTKAQAEETVKASGIPYTILRSSLVIGPGGGFVGKMLDLMNAPGPFIPVPGSGETKFQPIFVEDLARCILRAMDNPRAAGRTYEVGGPEHLSYDELLMILADVLGHKKSLLHIPMGLMMPIVRVFEKTGLSPVTSDQLGLLSRDNTCDPDAVRKEFGFEPIPYRRAVELSTLQREPGR
jgi:uncharacterized protein YbjT (DUF2867 family)